MNFDEAARQAAQAVRDRAQFSSRPGIDEVRRARSRRSAAIVATAAFVGTIVAVGATLLWRPATTAPVDVAISTTSEPAVAGVESPVPWSIAYPAEWHRADSELMPNLGWRSVTLATFPLLPGGECAHMPAKALSELDSDDALVTIFLSGVRGSAWPEGGFSDEVFPESVGSVDAHDCAGRPDLEVHWDSWSIGDSGVYVLVAFGDDIAPEKRTEAWAVLSSLHSGDSALTERGGACVVTRPHDPGFAPPEPYFPSPADPAMAWFGTDALWTALHTGAIYAPRKSVWWSADFGGGAAEERPEIAVTFERLDADAPSIVEGPPGTNANTPEDGWFMIAGIDPETAGCWRATATYRDAELSYVFEVPHDRGSELAESIDGAWLFVEGVVRGETIRPVAENPIDIVIDGLDMAGFAGCNSYSGRFRFADGSFTPDGSLNTRLTECSPDELIETERRYLEGLARVNFYAVDGDTLVLDGPDVSLRFERR